MIWHQQVFLLPFIFFTLSLSIKKTRGANATVEGNMFQYCQDHSFCSSNGLCYQNVGNPTKKFCSCENNYYGTKCENKSIEKSFELLVYILASLCVILLITLSIAAYLLCKRTKSISKDDLSKPWIPNAGPIYTKHNSDLELNVQNGIKLQNSKFDVTDTGLNEKNTFQSPSEDGSGVGSEEKPSESSEEKSKTDSDNSTQPIVGDNRRQSMELTQENLHYLDRQDNINTLVETNQNNLLPPMHARYTSQDSADIQTMDEIYRDYYASPPLYNTEPQRGVRTRGAPPPHLRGPLSPPNHQHQVMKTSPRSPNDRYGQPMSPSSQTSSRQGNIHASNRPISPSNNGMRMHPRTHSPHDTRDVQYRQHKQRSPRQQQQIHRPRSMGDISMVGLYPDYRHRARSVDNLDNMSMASSVENIHTGRVTRIVPSPKQHGQQQRGKGIWARTAADR